MSSMTITAGAPARDRAEQWALWALVGFAGALQVSIAAAQILLTLTLLCWVVGRMRNHDGFAAPRWFWPLAAYAGATLVSAIFSTDPRTSVVDSKQLALFLIVPAAYDLARGRRATTLLNVVITVGALSAIFGVVQYGLLHYNNLGQRPQGMMGHYMTYSGLLVLVIAAAVARLLFATSDRAWPALVLPALIVALVLTFTRSAWVGVSVAVAVLFTLKDRRLLAALPVLIAVTFAVAPDNVTHRFYSMFDLKDPTSRDRVAMLHTGLHMVRDHPLTGVGPNMVQPLYPQYRDPDAVQPVNPHLHNVPLQIAAERGMPALAIWTWMMVTVAIGLWRSLRTSRYPWLAATGLAAIAGMMGAGLFEYNFGDSEFLMLFLLLLTLPFAADRGEAATRRTA